MTARDDQPATVPPPAGEDDAYSAATKVGAMPADVMEKLRAEGLLPEEAAASDEVASAPRPSTSLEKRPTPVVEAPREVDLGTIPTLYSNAPPPKIDSVKPDAMTGPPPGPGDSVETPVAFAFPPDAALPKLAAAAEEAIVGTPKEEKTGAAKSRTPVKAAGPSPITFYAVAAFVVIALIVALFRLAR